MSPGAIPGLYILVLPATSNVVDETVFHGCGFKLYSIQEPSSIPMHVVKFIEHDRVISGASGDMRAE